MLDNMSLLLIHQGWTILQMDKEYMCTVQKEIINWQHTSWAMDMKLLGLQKNILKKYNKMV